MIDIEGLEISEADRRRLLHPNTGGVILFARNFETRAKLMALTSAIRELRPELIIAVDHEGGRVQRFRSDGFTSLPPMRRIGKLWDRDDSPSKLEAVRAASAVGYVLASELRACGIDLSFAPVLDLDWDHSEVIGDRAFHHDPRTVTLLAQALTHGMALAGMGNCGKHFPGHGWASADSHLALPLDERSLDTILENDAAPYGWFGIGLAAVMPAHVVYPEVDSLPAGFSPIWLQKVLRQKLGFLGVIISDDLNMEGARVVGDVVASAHAALRAGCDMLLACNKPDRLDKLLDGIEQPLPAASVARIAALKPTAAAPEWEALRASDKYAAAFKILKSL
ncbi:beta-N-acetylhexosaminidase [Derxia lacustris]|uniref:beta-N-acetylhexosaminidase n=1 Tax=Derxia lacustris TaxID=764842 RepID=UPI0038B40E03